MALTSTQIANTSAASYDAQFRYFAGIPYTAQLADGFTELWASWTGPDTGVPSGWTELTGLGGLPSVSWAGQLVFERQNSSITWTAQVEGSNFNSACVTTPSVPSLPMNRSTQSMSFVSL